MEKRQKIKYVYFLPLIVFGGRGIHPVTGIYFLTLTVGGIHTAGGAGIHPVTGIYFLTLTVSGTHIAVSGRKYTPVTRYTFLYLGVLGGDF